MKASDLYTCQRTGAGRNDFRLVPRQPIPTRDAATFRSRGPSVPLFGPNDSVRNATRRERGWTRDEINTPMTSGKTINRGTYWDGTGVNAKLDEKVAEIRDFVSGFIPGNIVGPEDPGTMISLGRVYLPRVADDEAREALARAMDEAEQEWRKDRRSQDQTTFRPGTQQAEAERYRQRSDGPLSTAMYPPTTDSATRRTLFGAERTRDYAASLRKGREAQTVTAPTKVRTAGDYAANLTAGRAAKRTL